MKKKNELLEIPQRKNKVRKTPPVLDSKNYTIYIKELKKINPISALIAEILWYLNRQLIQAEEFVTLQQLLSVTRINLIPAEGEALRYINLFRKDARMSHNVAHKLPEAIWERIDKQINPTSIYVFSNRKGDPLLPHNISKNFKKAGENIGIKGVTSMSFRSGILTLMDEVSLAEWKIICARIPEINTRIGKPSTYDPRIVFNAILFHRKTGVPIRKLPPRFPLGKSVHAQYLRWEKKGVFIRMFQELCRFRKTEK